MNSHLNLWKKTCSLKGFTLTELLIASAMTVAVLGGVSYGLLAVLNSNKIANANSQTQQMLNLGVEFVTDEIQSASQIDLAYDPTLAARFDDLHGDDPNIIPVLSLQIKGVSQRVIYYTYDKPEEDPYPWAGPVVLYRLGPDVGFDGNYTNPTEPDEWSGDPVIDLIGTRADLTTANAPTTCSNPTWTRIPSQDADLRGFFVCVRPQGDLAEIRALSVMDMKGVKTSENKAVTYQLGTKVATRSIDNADQEGDGAILNPITMKPNMPVNISGRAIYKRPGCSMPADSAIQLLADEGEYRLASVSQPLGATNAALIEIAGRISCSNSNLYNAYQRSGLRAKDGDTLSTLIDQADPPYIGNASQKAALIQSLANNLGATYYDSTTQKIKLPPNQNLFFLSDNNSSRISQANPQTYDYAIILTTVTRQ